MQAPAQGGEADLRERRPFRDYMLWMSQQDAGIAERYWTDALGGFTAPSTLFQPTHAGPTEEGQGWRNEEVSTELSEGVTATLQDFARSQGITLNTVVQGAWALLLGRYTDGDDVLFGATVSGRSADLDGIENIVGLFINTIPARVRIESELPLGTWLKTLQADQAGARAFEWCSLVDIHGWSGVPRNVPLFESIMVFSNWSGSATEEWEGDLEVHATRAAEGGTGYPLTVMVAPGPTLALSLGFDGRAHEPAGIARVLDHLRALHFATSGVHQPHQ